MGALAGAAISIGQIFATYPELRSLRWPLQVSGAVLYAGLAVLSFAGARWHAAVLLVAVIAMTAQVLGDYDNESWHVPLLSLAVIAFLVAYRQSRDGVRSLQRARLVVLGLSLIFALLAIAQMQEIGDAMNWERTRTIDGRTEVRSFVAAPPCAPPSPQTELLLDQGCDVVIPAERAGLMIGYGAAAMVLGAAAVAGAARKEPA